MSGAARPHRAPSVTAVLPVSASTRLAEPAFGRRVRRLRAALRRTCGSFEILLIVDGPQDGGVEPTWSPEVRLRRRLRRGGRGVVLREALWLARGSVLVCLDEGFPLAAPSFARLLAPLKRGADVVLAGSTPWDEALGLGARLAPCVWRLLRRRTFAVRRHAAGFILRGVRHGGGTQIRLEAVRA